MNDTKQTEESFQMRMVGCGERISYRCQRCADCCRNVEDAVMIETAARSGMDGIVTRNLRDYQSASVSVYTPSELLSFLNLPHMDA